MAGALGKHERSPATQHGASPETAGRARGAALTAAAPCAGPAPRDIHRGRSVATPTTRFVRVPVACTVRPPGHFYSPIASLDEVRQDEAQLFAEPGRKLPGISL